MQIYNEDDLLDERYRAALIKEIESPENNQRKAESYKRWEIFTDRIKKYVINQLEKELDADTLQEMETRVSCINIYKKMVSKKARVYEVAPQRKVAEGETVQEDLDLFTDELRLNVTMKKANKYLEAMQNIAVEAMPYEIPNTLNDDGNPIYKLKLNVIAPHSFDVIEDAKNPELVRAYIKSHYDSPMIYTREQRNREEGAVIGGNFRDGDSRNQTIADSPADNEKYYTFWSSSYHMVCNVKGQVLDRQTYEPLSVLNDSNEEFWINPIGRIPAVFEGKNCDGSFWSVGGEDLIDGTILVNHLLTDLYFIAKIQGMGLFYLFGKNIPSVVKVGPNKAVTVKVEEGDPTPQIGFASSNPPLDMHMQMVEQFVALLLSTNDLEPSSISGQLSATNAASGIQEMIQKSEPTNSIEDEQEKFRDLEPELVRICGAWQQLYSESDQLSPLYLTDTDMSQLDYSIKFQKPQPFITESEKLDNIKKKLELGVQSKLDAIMEANQGMDMEEAKKALLEISKERVEAIISSMESSFGKGNEEDNLPPTEEDQGQES